MTSAQRIIKYGAIALAAVIIVGIITGAITVIGLFGGVIVSGNHKGLDLAKFEENERVLSIDVASIKVNVKEGSEFNVETDSDYIKYKEVDGNKYSVTETKHTGWKNKNKTVDITIPSDIEFDKIYIETGAGEVIIDTLTGKDFELELGAGKVIAKNVEVTKKAKIDGGVGEVTFKNSTLTNLKLETGIGEFTLDAILKGKTKIETGIGEFTLHLLDSEENYSITCNAGIGDIKIGGTKVKNNKTYGDGENTISIDGGIGSIDITFKEA